MSKILNSTILNGKTAKMVELLDELCINGQVYDKSSLVPKPLEFLAVEGLACDIYFNTNADIPNMKHAVAQYEDNCVLMDDRKANESYIIMSDHTGCKILKFSGAGKDKKIEAELYKNIDATFKYNGSFLTQDESYVYLKLDSHLKNSQIGRINKTTNAIEFTNIGTELNKVTFLFDYQGELYFTVSEETNKFSIVRYNKISRAITTVLNDNGSKVSTSNFRVIPSAAALDYSFYCVRHDESFSGIKQLIIKRYIFDSVTSTFSSIQVNLDLSLLPRGFIPCYEGNDASNQYGLYEFTSKSNKQYMILTANRVDGKFYLFEKKNATDFVLTQIYELNTTFDTCIPYNQNKTLIMCKLNQIYFYNFNEADERFELTASLNRDYKRLGIDKNQNLWIQLRDYSIEAISNSMPVKVEALFQEKGYEYANEEIETLLLVYAADFKGGMVTTQVELTLVGPAYFSSTNTKTINVTTSNSAVIQVPVKITGAGFIKAITNVI